VRKPHCAFDELLTLGDIETRQTDAELVAGRIERAAQLFRR
jgi:hypothetical protein